MREGLIPGHQARRVARGRRRRGRCVGIAVGVLALLAFPSVAHAVPATITFDDGRLKLGGFDDPIDIVRAAKPVELGTDIAPDGDFTVDEANFVFHPVTREVQPGVNVTLDVIPLADVTGNYNRATGRLRTNGSNYRAEVDVNGTSCTISPVPLALSTAKNTPFPGDSFDAGSVPPVNGAVVDDWADLPVPIGDPGCSSFDMFSGGPGGIQLSNGTQTPPPPPPPPPPDGNGDGDGGVDGASPPAPGPGTYVGETEKGKLVRVKVGDDGLVSKMKHKFKAPCRPSGCVRGGLTWEAPLDESTQTSFADKDRGKEQSRGLRLRFKGEVEGEKVSDTEWEGTFKVRIRVSDHGRTVARCKTGEVDWSATLVT